LNVHAENTYNVSQYGIGRMVTWRLAFMDVRGRDGNPVLPEAGELSFGEASTMGGDREKEPPEYMNSRW